MDHIEWYRNLIKPPFTPPETVFEPVWAILYAMIILSFLLFWFASSTEKKTVAFWLFIGQMALNICWTPVFFGMKNPIGALGVLVVMVVLLALTILRFYKISKPAAFLLLPYFFWGIFAFYLNVGIVVLN